MAKRPVVLCLVMLAGWVLSLACSQTTRYHVLSFFFDGVPEVGRGGPAGAQAGDRASPAVEPGPTVLPKRFYAHTPYRENRCQGCHDPTSGQLIRSVAEGLCLSCHAKLIADARFVHGPVAVDDCTVCHHFHGASFPNQLLLDPVATCLNCHDRADLSTGDHHAMPDPRSCEECHNPHAGDNRFFLKRTGP